MAYSPAQAARQALRTALRNHPQAESVLCNRRVNDLAVADLHKALITLGLDPIAITASVIPINPVGPQPRIEIDQLEPDFEDADACDPAPQDEPIMPETPDAVEIEVQAIRELVIQGGFGALDERLRELIREAHKPAIEVVREVMVPSETGPGPVEGALVPHASRTGKHGTWSGLFGVEGSMGKRTTELWDGAHPDTPKVNDRYIWPHPETEAALCQLARGRNVYFFGPKGTGKTEFSQQLAARTGRPYALISCDSGTDAATLVGMTVPDGDGVRFQPGQLTRAIQTPGCVICLDEPSIARPGALFVLQNVLANRQLFVAETGAKINVAPGVLFVATDNTNGTGGGSKRGYTDTQRLNAAFLDRFGVYVRFDYMARDAEADAIVGYTGCTRELAMLLVNAATVTRAAADNQTLSHGISFRRLLSWAESLSDGIDPEHAFQIAVLNTASEQDVEALREQCLLAYDRAQVAAALHPSQPTKPDPAIVNPTPAGRAAAGDFQAYRP